VTAVAEQWVRAQAQLTTAVYLWTAQLSRTQARYLHREHGQGVVEYGLVITAVSLAVIVAVFALGPKISSLFSRTSTSLQ
jgi:Flp pilus assembly pilin Flp